MRWTRLTTLTGQNFDGARIGIEEIDMDNDNRKT